MFCGMCGKELKEGAKFCSHCGWSVPEMDTITEEVQTKSTKKVSGKKRRLFVSMLAAIILLVVGLSVGICVMSNGKHKKDGQTYDEGMTWVEP